MLVQHSYDKEAYPTHEGYCPCCKRGSTFFVTGEQRWPHAVAEKAGMPELIRLWTCQSCHSTVSEIDLIFE